MRLMKSVHDCKGHSECGSTELTCSCQGECIFLHSIPDMCIECGCTYGDSCVADMNTENSLCERHGVVLPVGRVCAECWVENGCTKEVAKKQRCDFHTGCTVDTCACKGVYCVNGYTHMAECEKCGCKYDGPCPAWGVEGSVLCEKHGQLVQKGYSCDDCGLGTVCVEEGKTVEVILTRWASVQV